MFQGNILSTKLAFVDSTGAYDEKEPLFEIRLVSGVISRGVNLAQSLENSFLYFYEVFVFLTRGQLRCRGTQTPPKRKERKASGGNATGKGRAQGNRRPKTRTQGKKRRTGESTCFPACKVFGLDSGQLGGTPPGLGKSSLQLSRRTNEETRQLAFIAPGKRNAGQGRGNTGTERAIRVLRSFR